MASQAMIDVDKHVYAWSSRISSSIVLLFVTTTLCIHMKNIHQHIKSTKNSHLSPSLIFSILLHIFIIFFNIFTVWATYEKVEDIPRCQIIGYGAGAAYMFAKWSLYMLLSCRIGEVFRGSAFEYSATFLHSWQSFLTVGVTGNAVLNTLYSRPYINHNLSFLTCDTEINTIVLGYTALFDITACSVNLILFIIPYKKLNKSMIPKEHSQSKSSLTFSQRMQSATSTLTRLGYFNGHMRQPTNDDGEENSGDESPSIYSISSMSTTQSRSDTSHESNKNIEIVNIPVKVVETKPLENAMIAKALEKRKKRKKKKERKEKNKLFRVIKKLTLLTAIGVGSTIVNAMLIGIFSIPILWYV